MHRSNFAAEASCFVSYLAIVVAACAPPPPPLPPYVTSCNPNRVSPFDAKAQSEGCHMSGQGIEVRGCHVPVECQVRHMYIADSSKYISDPPADQNNVVCFFQSEGNLRFEGYVCDVWLITQSRQEQPYLLFHMLHPPRIYNSTLPSTTALDNRQQHGVVLGGPARSALTRR